MTSRILLTAAGAAGLIAGAFLKWTRDLEGTHVSWRAFYQSTFADTNDLVKSVGGASILLGLVALLGLAEATGWLTRLAGAVGLVGTVLFIIQVIRFPRCPVPCGSNARRVDHPSRRASDV